MLIFTHEGATILAAAIVATLLLRGMRHPVFLEGGGRFVGGNGDLGRRQIAFPPDDYFADVYIRAALSFFDEALLNSRLLLLLLAAIAGYSVVFFVLLKITPARAHLYAAAIVAVALAVYWILALDHGLHAADRYYMRTVLFIAMPLLGALAAMHAFRADGRQEMSPYRRTSCIPDLLCRGARN